MDASRVSWNHQPAYMAVTNIVIQDNGPTQYGMSRGQSLVLDRLTDTSVVVPRKVGHCAVDVTSFHPG